MSKKLQEKQQRRLAEEAKRARQKKDHRRANLITVGIAALVVLAVAAVLVFQGEDPADDVGVGVSEANCTERDTFESEGNQHVDVGTPVEYAANPPTTGNHWPPEAVSDAGFFEEPIPPQSLIHNQEHGQIVIWYDPDAPPEVIDDIETMVGQEGGGVNIAAPWDDIEEPHNYVLSAWSGEADEGVQQSCELASQEIWDEFRADFQAKGPENVGFPTFSAD
ncbi:MAG: DUF3105 domain-containing protein [Actinomycetota bacterium]